MLTMLSSGFTKASPSELALSAALAVLFATLGYRMSVRHRALRGVTPWRLPSLAWALICLVLQFLGLALEVVAELTTRAPYSPAGPRGGPVPPGEPGTRFAPPATPPVAVEPPALRERAAAGAGAVAVPAALATAAPSPGELPPPLDAAGRPALFGWYPDPRRRHELRYFDGRRWSEHVANGRQLAVDPL